MVTDIEVQLEAVTELQILGAVPQLLERSPQRIEAALPTNPGRELSHPVEPPVSTPHSRRDRWIAYDLSDGRGGSRDIWVRPYPEKERLTAPFRRLPSHIRGLGSSVRVDYASASLQESPDEPLVHAESA